MNGKVVFFAFLLVTVMVRPPPVAAVTTTISGEMASARVFRGATLHDDWILQSGVRLHGFPRPAGAGILAEVPFSSQPPDFRSGQFSRLELHADYQLPALAGGLIPVIGVREFIYPVTGSPADREVFMTFTLDRFCAPALALNYGLDGALQRELYAEISLGNTWDAAPTFIDLSAGAAFRDNNRDRRGFSHAWVSAGLSRPVLFLSLSAIHRISDRLLPDDRYQVRLVGRIGAAVEF